ncbi:hypothetical protein PPL_06554 [Heterostelium album PN500]|uniref:COI1 F-box domain-containing protein n=1 Tax=Heterostelium pallidum (strain ATCC 26659 / Pp 5 / PN500) TaxID=670386 RepID=D3BDH1_HETP5|nr:hypothetical protein PPL_06554 [Heterostelium album PN500]EFA80615.1 hypothetical protein PPL_06554 [Heterostelium album PN500]|eukprot:XP_020432735.1 hypothetical protein PPL_06554 [Heterostelium album PN500]
MICTVNKLTTASYSMNNNDNRLVNLSHLILSKIINYIDDNVDRIVFTLVCKRWFNERHKYLSFKTDHIININKCNVNQDSMCLKSYKSIYIDSFKHKNNYYLHVIRGDTIDYKMTPEQLIEINEIPPKFSAIAIDIDSSDATCYEMYRLISRSQVTTLERCRTLRYRLPENLTNISFISFNEPLLPGYLPQHLKSLEFAHGFNQPIKKGDLPNTLEILNLGDDFKQAIEPGVLPSSLKVLKYYGGHILKVGSLPPNLEEFYFLGNTVPIDDGVLPLTLCEVKAPLSWLPSIKSLSNIKSLILYQCDIDSTIDLSYLPCSLTKLAISQRRRKRLISTMPPSIKHLDLTHLSYNIDEIFKDRSQYHFEYLKLDGYKPDSLDNLKIDDLELDLSNPFKYKVESIIDIPEGIEILQIRNGGDLYLDFEVIPSTVKRLILDYSSTFKFNSNETLPSGLQELAVDLDDWNEDLTLFPSDVLPPSLQSLTIPAMLLPQPRIPNNLILIPELSNGGDEHVWLRRLDDHHYLFFSEEPFYTSAIVHESNIPNIFAYYESTLYRYFPRWIKVEIDE